MKTSKRGEQLPDPDEHLNVTIATVTYWQPATLRPVRPMNGSHPPWTDLGSGQYYSAPAPPAAYV
jgi:hypothetical protein